MTARRANNAFTPLALFAALLIGAGAAEASEAEMAAQNFAQADVDGNGALTRSEFTTFIDLNAADGLGNAATVKRAGRYATAFKRVDANGDGNVTLAEMRSLAGN